MLYFNSLLKLISLSLSALLENMLSNAMDAGTFKWKKDFFPWLGRENSHKHYLVTMLKGIQKDWYCLRNIDTLVSEVSILLRCPIQKLY